MNGVPVDNHYPFGDIICPIEGIEEVKNPENLVGRPLENLLRHAVPLGKYDEKQPTTQSLNLTVVDAKRKWSVRAERRDKRWIIVSLS